MADEDAIVDENGALRPDAKLLDRLQDKLKQQLQTERDRLQEELREKQNAVIVSKLIVTVGHATNTTP